MASAGQRSWDRIHHRAKRGTGQTMGVRLLKNSCSGVDYNTVIMRKLKYEGKIITKRPLYLKKLV